VLILPNVSLTEPTISAVALKKLKSFLTEKAKTCLHKPEGLLRYRYVTPTYEAVPGADDNSEVPERSSVGHYLQMYDWDACLFSQAQSYLGVKGLAKEIVLNFLHLKEKDGYVPRTVSPARTWDTGDICKPFLSQALLHEAGSPDNLKDSLTNELIDDLDSYLAYFSAHRKHSSGLYHWRNMLESGVDDSVSLIAPVEAAKDENEDIGVFIDGKLLAVDLNSYLVAEYEAFSQIAQAMGRTEIAAKYSKEAKALTALIEEHLWNESLAIYCNLDPATGKQVRIRNWTGLTPLMFGFAKPERAKLTIEKTILASEHFLRPHGLTSLAASDLLYNQAKRGLYSRALVANWQGPVWVLPNVLTVRALIKYGYEKQAKDIASRVLSTMIGAINTTGTTYENYNAETGEPLWAPQFMSWNVLALELIALIE
jgi:glycogen debranching enzyme